MAIEIEEWEIRHTYTTYLESTNIDLLESARRLVASGVAECAMLRDGRTYWRSNGMGQRRYVESLSAYARQFLERIEKPDADVIDGIAPAVATRNPRSTTTCGSCSHALAGPIACSAATRSRKTQWTKSPLRFWLWAKARG